MIWPWQRRVELTAVPPSHVAKYVSDWLETQAISTKLARHLAVIEAKKEGLGGALDHLAHARLHNERIPVRHIQMMEGNRAHYLAAVRRLLEGTHFSPSYPTVQQDVDAFFSSLEATSKAIARNHQVLKEYLDSEVSAAGKALWSLESAVRALRQELAAPTLAAAGRVQTILEERAAQAAYTRDAKAQRAALKAELHGIEAQRAANAAQKAELFASLEWAEYQALQAQQQLTQDRLKTLSQSLRDHLGRLERPLRKLVRVSRSERAIQAYLDDPTNALASDENLGIRDVLGELAQAATGLVEPAKLAGLQATIRAAQGLDFAQHRQTLREATAALQGYAEQLARHPASAKAHEIDTQAAALAASEARLRKELRETEGRIRGADADTWRRELNEALLTLGATLSP